MEVLINLFAIIAIVIIGIVDVFILEKDYKNEKYIPKEKI